MAATDLRNGVEIIFFSNYEDGDCKSDSNRLETNQEMLAEGAVNN
jgi:hypothetical protein